MKLPVRAALCLAVLLAGCGGVGGGQGEARTGPTQTVTPAPVPTEATPAVSEAVDGDRLLPLVERHEAALKRRSFTALGRRVVTGPVGVLLDVRWERRVAAGRETYHVVRSGTTTWGWDGRDPIDQRHHYYTGNRTLTRYVEGDEARYEVETDPTAGGPAADLDGADHLGELFAAFETWRIVRYPNGSVALSGRGLERPSVVRASAPSRDPRNATVEVRVAPGGRVASASVRFEATIDGMPVSVVEERRYVAVGETDTDPPPWYDSAHRPQTNASARSATPYR